MDNFLFNSNCLTILNILKEALGQNYSNKNLKKIQIIIK